MGRELASGRISLGQWGYVEYEHGAVTLRANDSVSELRRASLEAGAVVAVRHHLAGDVALHASCICLGSGAVAFVGRSGVGKSTLAAAIAREGFELIADGLTIVDPASLLVVRRPKRFLLTDESILRLGIKNAGDYVNEDCLKRSVWRAEEDARQPARLVVVYSLADSDRECIESLSPLQQLRLLLENLFLKERFPSSEHPILLERAAALINRGLVVRRLCRRKDWSALPTLVALIRSQVA